MISIMIVTNNGGKNRVYALTNKGKVDEMIEIIKNSSEFMRVEPHSDIAKRYLDAAWEKLLKEE